MLKRRGPEGGPDADVEEDLGPPLDELTGLRRRAEFNGDLSEILRQARANSSRLAVFFLRLTELAEVNELYGPNAGDRMLMTAAQRLTQALGDNVPTYRWLGAEFALLWPAVTTVEAATKIAEQVHHLIAEPIQLGEAMVPLTCAVGAALSDEGYSSQEEFLQDAHGALSVAAADELHPLCVHDESTRNRLQVRVDRGRLEDALKRSEFLLHYQPVIDLRTGRAVGAEALLRWQDTRLGTGLVPPGAFVPLLERTRLMGPVGGWVVEEACRQAAAWNASRPEGDRIWVSVNLGGRQVQDAGFADRVVGALDAVGMAPELLCLDLTEACLAINGTRAWTSIRPLKMLGIQVGMDDFGTGAAALSFLREFSLDYVRIGKEFIDGITDSPDDAALVRRMTEMAHDLGLRAIAEGIEDEAHAAAVAELGVDLGQGFLWAKPDVADVITAHF